MRCRKSKGEERETRAGSLCYWKRRGGSWLFGCLSQVGVDFGEVFELVVGVESGGVGEDPEMGVGDGFGLESEGGVAVGEGEPVGAEAEDGEESGAVAEEFSFEELGGGRVFGGGEVGGAGGCGGDDVGQTIAEIEQCVIFVGREEVGSEAGGMKCGPEAISGAGEVVADSGGIEAGIDAAEEDFEVGSDEIGEGFPDACFDLLGRWSLAVMDHGDALQ